MNGSFGRQRDSRFTVSVRLPIIFGLVLLGCVIIEPILLTGANIQSALTTYVVEIALVTAGQTLVITTGGIDLSVAGTVALVGVFVGRLSADGRPTIMLLAAGLGIGVCCGLFNGLVVTQLRVPPIMVTLATGILFRGLAEGLANGQFYNAYPSDFVQLGQGYWFGVPAQVWIAGVALLLAMTVMGTTRYGRWVYAIGANARAARLSGVPVARTLTGVYVCSGGLAALAALVMSARLNSAGPDMGVGLELASITAAVLGGVSVLGGKGTIFGALLGVLTIAALRSGLTLHDVSAEIQNMGVATLLLVVLILERVQLAELLRRMKASTGPPGIPLTPQPDPRPMGLDSSPPEPLAALEPGLEQSALGDSR